MDKLQQILSIPGDFAANLSERNRVRLMRGVIAVCVAVGAMTVLAYLLWPLVAAAGAVWVGLKAWNHLNRNGG